MNAAGIRQQVQAIAGLPGVLGAALLELEGSLPWCSSGDEDLVRMAEAATDHWRLTLRHGHTFAALGGLKVQVLVHAQGRVTAVACPRDLLLVTVSAEPDAVDWRTWTSCVGLLHAVIRGG